MGISGRDRCSTVTIRRIRQSEHCVDCGGVTKAQLAAGTFGCIRICGTHKFQAESRGETSLGGEVVVDDSTRDRNEKCSRNKGERRYRLHRVYMRGRNLAAASRSKKRTLYRPKCFNSVCSDRSDENAVVVHSTALGTERMLEDQEIL